MKKIVFVRHGRAEDPSSEITDFERSLTLKGKADLKDDGRQIQRKRE